jgi:hypothetical protein
VEALFGNLGEISLSNGNIIRDAGDAIRGILEAIPVYRDLLQPATKEAGAAIETLVKVAALPVRALGWGHDQIVDFFRRFGERIRDIPP